jgi:hypothetical protein
MQVVNTKTQTTNTKRNNSMLFQDEEDLGKFLKEKNTFDSKFFSLRSITIINVDWFKFKASFIFISSILL